MKYVRLFVHPFHQKLLNRYQSGSVYCSINDLRPEYIYLFIYFFVKTMGSIEQIRLE